MSLSEPFAVSITAFLILASIIVDSLEVLSAPREYAAGGMFSWPVRRTLFVPRGAVLPQAWLDMLLIGPRFLWLVRLEVVLALVAMIAGTNYMLLITGILIPFRALMMIRNGRFGGDGATQMMLVILVALTLYGFAPSPLARRAALWFVAGQLMLAYLTSGLVKAFHSEWRDGTAIQAVYLSDLFGFPPAANIIQRYSWLPKAICWGVICFECGAPLFLFMGTTGCLAFLCIGFLFHLMIAVSHGLNLFLFAFTAAYPAALLTAKDLAGVLHR